MCKKIFFLSLLPFTIYLPHLDAAELNSPQSHQTIEQADHYLEGYIQALVNSHYYEFDLSVYVENYDVYLHNLPKNRLIRNSIISFIQEIPEVRSVHPIEKLPDSHRYQIDKRKMGNSIKGIWFPQTTMLYPPMTANPRETIYSATYGQASKMPKEWDASKGKQLIMISLGDHFPLFRWRHLFSGYGDLQVDIQAGIWSVFNMGKEQNTHEFSELLNTDYLVGIPISYALGNWACRLRAYHVSCHLGDEMLSNFARKESQPLSDFRLNPSMEALDYMLSYQANDALRLYGGGGWVFHSDRTLPLAPFYVEYGGEWRFFRYKSLYHRLYSACFLAGFFRNWQSNGWSPDINLMVGYEWSKLQGVGRKVRLFYAYRDGYGDGQFFSGTYYGRLRYSGGGLAWGF
ncbi:MAG: DUF1207 domain-containing protein [Chlamydiota bacterium]|nr:DUF1207 domain-containing protein [Chlamydiota bacterium]